MADEPLTISQVGQVILWLSCCRSIAARAGERETLHELAALADKYPDRFDAITFLIEEGYEKALEESKQPPAKVIELRRRAEEDERSEIRVSPPCPGDCGSPLDPRGRQIDCSTRTPRTSSCTGPEAGPRRVRMEARWRIRAHRPTSTRPPRRSEGTERNLGVDAAGLLMEAGLRSAVAHHRLPSLTR
jgi:hypothetical protein